MNRITAQTKVVALFGDPVGHSLSPVMHNAWLAAEGIDAVYLAVRLHGQDIAAAFAALGQVELMGANVTVPHKAAALAAFAPGDTLTAAIGAANTLVWQPRGGVLAYNTDAQGFTDSLTAAGVAWQGQPALLLGAGGAARAIGFGLGSGGAAVVIANRDRTRAERLAADLRAAGHSAEAIDWADRDRGVAGAGLVINTTTQGMVGQDPLALDLTAAGPTTTVIDIVYVPLETPLLAAATACGLRTVDGLGMLIHQGALAFARWFGKTPDIAAARPLLLDALAARGTQS